MELMSALLLYALAATAFHGGLGIKTKPQSDIKLNTSLMINPSNGIPRKKILLNINGPPLVSMISELRSIFEDPNCKQCVNCMKMALKAEKNNSHVKVGHPPNQLYYEVLKEHFQKLHRQIKRNIEANETGTDKGNSKGVTVTKYATDDGKVYAVKVNDTNSQTSKQSDPQSTCKIYSVKKTLSCNYDENDLLLAIVKTKETKKSKKFKNKKTVNSTKKTTPKPAVYKKREVRVEENSHVPEGFMPSIEDLY